MRTKVNKSDNVFLYHQIKIAKDTLKMSDIGIMIMGGMTKDEAKRILTENNIKI